MNCPKCQDDMTDVIDSRKKPLGVHRRRECLVCGYRYSTIEIDVKRFKLLQAMADQIHGFAEELDNLIEAKKGMQENETESCT